MSPNQSETTYDTVYKQVSALLDQAEITIRKDTEKANEILQSAEAELQESAQIFSESAHLAQLKLKVQLLWCRIHGKKQEFEPIISSADEALNILAGSNLKNSLEYQCISNYEASALGYKGFALMKMRKYDDAMFCLNRSYELRTSLKKQTARVNDREGEDVKAARARHSNREEIAVEEALAICCRKKGIQAPLPPIMKFSRTAHLFDMGGTAVTSDDLVVSNDDGAFAAVLDGKNDVIIEEKVDGANFGITLSADGQIVTQNRSHYVSSGDHAQFSPLMQWIEVHRSSLVNLLQVGGGGRTASQGLVLFGEWVVAKHSIAYDKLPGNFLAFDIYDRLHRRFYSRVRFHDIMSGSGIPVVPVIDVVRFGPYTNKRSGRSQFQDAVKRLISTPSQFRSDGGLVEGIILRIDEKSNENDEALWLEERFKVVRPDFVAGCAEGHWMTRPVEKQVVDYEFANDYMVTCYPFATANRGEGHLKQAESNQSTDTKPAAAENTGDTVKKKLSKAETKTHKDQIAARARMRRRAPKYVILMGLPASGKSTFANRLENSRLNREDGKHGNNTQALDLWVVVNQDKLGKKASIDLAGRSASKHRVVLDRCNPSASDRRFWMDVLHNPPKSETALIHFASDIGSCVGRAKQRVGHETIPEGRGEKIIKDMAKRMEPPTADEVQNVFGLVEMVHSFEESEEILRRWGVFSEQQ